LAEGSDPADRPNGRTGFQKVAPISEPLTDWLNSLAPSTVEMLQGCLLPVSVLTGIVAVVTPDIMVEMELKRLQRMAAQGMPLTPPRAPTPVPAPPVPTTVEPAVTVGTGAIVAPPADL
jgi:hypothetical protein